MSTFNFQQFLETMKDKSAIDIVTEIKGFIAEYNVQRLLPDQFVAKIRTFLEETGDKLARHELWRNASEEELDNAKEGLEKYMMNKMYKVCFQPAMSDDASEDQSLSDRLAMLGFVKPEHLDIKCNLGEPDCASMVERARKELCRMNDYKAPRDKMVCVLNCCKIINNILHLSIKNAGADDFFPLFIYIIVSARPPNLYSNMRFIDRFRNKDKLTGEAGYYFTNLQSAIAFAAKIEAGSLTIGKEEFDREMDACLQRMPATALEASTETAEPSSGTLIDLGMDGAAPPARSQKSPAAPPKVAKMPPAAAVQSKPKQDEADALPRKTSYGNLLSLDMPAEPAPKTTPLLTTAPSSSMNMGLLGGFGIGQASGGDGSNGARADGGTALPLGNAASKAPIADVRRPQAVAEDPEVLHELMAALREPPVAKFLASSVEDLQMVDIPLLLSDYKRMAKLTGQVKTFFEAQGYVFKV
mmetsp:Transcript_17886/g.46713  ORF Transcript_17886/g.46713 Transcript_17886/m.46713 type:complete len:471 (+) Transcript_17886:281-1693(+)